MGKSILTNSGADGMDGDSTVESTEALRAKVAHLEAALAERHAIQERMQAAIGQLPSVFFLSIHDGPEGRRIQASPQAEAITGHAMAAIAAGQAVVQDLLDRLPHEMAEASPESRSGLFDASLLSHSEEPVYLRVAWCRLHEFTGPRTELLAFDMTEATRLQKDLEAAHDDRLAFQQVLARLADVPPQAPAEDLWQACLNGFVEQYGFRMAWFGYYESNEIRPQIHAGHADHYLEDLVLRIAEPSAPDRQCAMSRAVLDNRPFGYADLAHDEGFRAWREYALELGYASNLCIPFVVDGACEGGVMVYDARPHAFGEERIEQLSFLAGELARRIAQRRRDIKAAADLAASHEIYRSMVENVGSGVALISADMRILSLNRQMREWFPDIDPGERPICYRAFNRPPRERPCTYCPTNKTLRDGEVHEAVTETPVDGEVRNYRIVATPVRDGAGHVTAAIELVEDITEKKRLEAQLIRSDRLAALGTLASGIAHEFNNINVSILGFSQLALEHPDTQSELRDWIGRIRHAARRARGITQNLLAFSRQSADAVVPANLVTVARDTLELVREQFRKEDIDVVERLVPLPAVPMDPAQIGQVILNLLINAQHALLDRPERRITLTSGRDVHRVYLSVEDTGCGISKSNMEVIFNPFFSTKGEYAESGSLAAVKGTGLGLSVSHTIVENHGGEITVESRVGHGTTFTVWLPLRRDDPKCALE